MKRMPMPIEMYLVIPVVIGIIVVWCASCSSTSQKTADRPIIAAENSNATKQSKEERRAFFARLDRQIGDGNIPYLGKRGTEQSSERIRPVVSGPEIYLSGGFSSRETEFHVMRELRNMGYSVSRGWGNKGLTLELQLENLGNDMAVCTATLLDRNRNILAQGMGRSCRGILFIGFSSSSYSMEERMRRGMEIEASLEAIKNLDRDYRGT